MKPQPKLRLTIHLIAEQVSADDLFELELEPCEATEVISLVVPYIEPKQLDLSKVMQGATEAVIRKHQVLLDAELRKRADEEKKRKDREQLGLWTQSAENGTGAEQEPARAEA